MPLSFALTRSQNISGLTAVITNTTANYGISGNPNRTDRAEYLLYSQNDEEGERTYIALPTALPLSQLTWEVPSIEQGWEQGTLLSISKWDTATSMLAQVVDGEGIITTYASIKYYTPTNKVYKCIQNNTNIAPDSGSGSQYWTEVTDFTTLIGYTSVEQFTEDFQSDFSIDKCVTKGFINVQEKCGCEASLKELEPALRNWALFFSMTANFQNEAPEKMDAIATELAKICKTCA